MTTGTGATRRRYLPDINISERDQTEMRAILLWTLGIPIPIIIMLYLFGVFH